MTGNKRFSTVLIANRGEIAVRVIRACREMGMRSVAIHSDADANAPHVRMADEAVAIGGNAASESYLVIAKILDAAKRSGAEAIHPGYGFLSENADFADACAAAGLTFIGPRGDVIRAMGSKVASRQLMKAADVPGDTEPVLTVDDVLTRAEEIGFPIAIKAASGGGGKGFRVAHKAEEAKAAFEGASSEGLRFFGDGTVYVERYLPDPRHVEVQVVADEHGNVIHLGERDCSVQRRHQKLIEEAPAPAVDAALRQKIGAIAVNAARSIGYTSVGTIEGLLVGGEFYFLEMNTRLQVEHPATELVTGIDVVRTQIAIAQGNPLPFTQADVTFRGHAIECRINAEDAAKGFLPRPGTVSAYREPSGPGVRVDSGIEAGSVASPFYDPLLAKLIVWDEDRERATRRMLRALDEFRIDGLKTLVPFHKAFLATEEWASGGTGHKLLTDKAFLSTIGTEIAPAPAVRAAE
ncbi:acetyl/propionyl/methylcrotonyl-CoA carboxylase subunit alpha [Mesorhizobium sp. IMUNJ 23232]|uniref:acetyl/propionyl/methylcrotonyl-CoA carboxylase subunit alpha n=1 Tax=Mesorhizobium sp. IMUNJ 23232 TaxID=3376064 RepID=UPI00379507A3